MNDNINILNYASYSQTAQYVDIMSSNGFLSLITRPSKVTAASATLIDNIFTNNRGDINHSVWCLFVTDISDHFPVFHIAKHMEIKENHAYVYKRLYRSWYKEQFCHAMGNVRWHEISRAIATQQAVDTFTSTWLKCTISISLKLELKGNITTKSHGCLKVWKVPSNK